MSCEKETIKKAEMIVLDSESKYLKSLCNQAELLMQLTPTLINIAAKVEIAKKIDHEVNRLRPEGQYDEEEQIIGNLSKKKFNYDI